MPVRGGIIRVTTEHTIRSDHSLTVLTHNLRWSFETRQGRPVVVGVYDVPDEDWPQLCALLRTVGERWPSASPGVLVKHVLGVATRCRWDAQR